MTPDQITGAKHYAAKIGEATFALHVLELADIGFDGDAETSFSGLRSYYRDQIKRNLTDLAAELGYRLEPASHDEKEAA